MQNSNEKRSAKRFPCSPSLTYQFSLFNEAYKAQGNDYSDYGMSFKSDERIQPGTIVFIKHKDYTYGGLDNETYNGFRSLTFATVKWCKEYKQVDSRCYKIGAKYLIPNDVSFF